MILERIDSNINIWVRRLIPMIGEREKRNIYKGMVSHFMSNDEYFRDVKIKKAISEMLIRLRDLLNIDYNEHCEISKEVIMEKQNTEYMPPTVDMKNIKKPTNKYQFEEKTRNRKFEDEIGADLPTEPPISKGKDFGKKVLLNNVSILGVGNAGLNILSELFDRYDNESDDLNLIGLDTCLDDIRQCIIPNKKYIGAGVTGKEGAERNRMLGKKAGKKYLEKLEPVIKKTDAVIVTFGLGGGTGTGAGVELIKGIKRFNKMVIAIVTLPFKEEGVIKKENSIAGLNKMNDYADKVIILPNDYLTSLDPELPLIKGFQIMDKIMAHAIFRTHSLLLNHSEMSTPFFNGKDILSVTFGREVDVLRCWNSTKEDFFDFFNKEKIKEVLVFTSTTTNISEGEKRDYKNEVHNTFDSADSITFVEEIHPDLDTPIEMTVLFGPYNANLR